MYLCMCFCASLHLCGKLEEEAMAGPMAGFSPS